jgi:hypothetical protein
LLVVVVRTGNGVALPLARDGLPIGNAMGSDNDGSCGEMVRSGTETVERK